jgi:hypothetical protein
MTEREAAHSPTSLMLGSLDVTAVATASNDDPTMRHR